MLGALEKQGLDFWWIDWQQGEGTPSVPVSTPLVPSYYPVSTPSVPREYPFSTP